jgi:hypothetical protein
MLVSADGRRIDKGPTEIVSDPRRPDRAPTTPQSPEVQPKKLPPRVTMAGPSASRRASRSTQPPGSP